MSKSLLYDNFSQSYSKEKIGKEEEGGREMEEGSKKSTSLLIDVERWG